MQPQGLKKWSTGVILPIPEDEKAKQKDWYESISWLTAQATTEFIPVATDCVVIYYCTDFFVYETVTYTASMLGPVTSG